MLRLFGKHVCCDTTIISTEHHPGDTVASMNQPNQLWHYPGKVDTVSKVMNIQVSKPTNRWESDIGCGAVGMSRRS